MNTSENDNWALKKRTFSHQIEWIILIGLIDRTLDCSQSPIFPWDFRDSYASIELPPSWFVRANATWEECLNYRGGPSQVTLRSVKNKYFSRRLPTPGPLGSLNTLPRLCSLLQTKMVAVQSKRTSLENPKIPRKNRGL